MIKSGDFVLIRTYSAGVHFGTFVSKEGQEVHLKNARRLWQWAGAFSLSEVAMEGIKVKDSKISVLVDEIILTQVIEIIAVSKKSNLPGNESTTRKSVSAEV